MYIFKYLKNWVLHNEQFRELAQISVRISRKAVNILDLRERKLNPSCRFRRGL